MHGVLLDNPGNKADGPDDGSGEQERSELFVASHFKPFVWQVALSESKEKAKDSAIGVERDSQFVEVTVPEKVFVGVNVALSLSLEAPIY